MKTETICACFSGSGSENISYCLKVPGSDDTARWNSSSCWYKVLQARRAPLDLSVLI